MRKAGWTRFLALLLTLSLAAVLLLPWLCGQWIQQRLLADAERMRQWLDAHGFSNLDIRVIEARQYWLSSDYSLRFSWRGSDRSIDLHNTISHGPFPWAMLRDGQAQPHLAQIQSRLDFQESGLPFVMPELQFAQTVDFAGNFHLDWRFLGYLNQHSEGKLDVASSHGELHYSRTERRLHGVFDVPDMRLSLPEYKLQLTEFSFTFDISQGDSVLPVGESVLQLSGGRLQHQSGDYRMGAVRQQVLLSEFDGLSNIQLVLFADNLSSPELVITQNEWDVILRGISESSLAALIPEKAFESLQHSLPAMWEQAVARAPQLLSGTEFEVAHFFSRTPQGPVQGFLRTDVPPIEAVVEAKPIDLLQQVDLAAELSLPKTMLRDFLAHSAVQSKFRLSEKYRHLKRRVPEEELRALEAKVVDQQLNVILMQGLLREQQGQYWTAIELRQGQLYFNGHLVHGF